MGKSVYEMVSERIIEELEKGVIPWRKPWSGVTGGAYNRITRKPYSLLNQLMLKHTGEYATYKQWQDAGGQVRKGEKSEFVVFWKPLAIEEKQADGTVKKSMVPLLRYYNVFHISQVDGVVPLTDTDKPAGAEPIAEAERIKEGYKVRERIQIIETTSNDAFYSPSMDYIQVPSREQYSRAEEFYSTLFHEMVHSTGHKSRLNRLTSGAEAAFGGQEYSKEELVAEIGSACILNTLGIETERSFENSAAYVQSWLKVLRNDTRFIVSAASRAEKAVNYIFGKKQETEEV